MGLGNTAKKLSKLADVAEELFKRVNAMRAEIDELRSAVEHTETDTAELRREVAQQRALVEALAEREGIDVEAIREAADVPETAGTTAAERAEEASEETPSDDATAASD
ncbi:MAG: DUF5798 family protein [Halobaculum sp.]